ncbi:TonB-dependent receptor plug domain-containing protein [Qipengyuania sp. MTN3-11]|uniref:TonB-dependent receptor plug domain-containing protein n=1 Tax=Qipengyuania sp. MTN3-11 TaxID=3056557 RepID=UPI0036F3861E
MMLKSRGLPALLAGTALVVFATPLRAQAGEQPGPAPDDTEASQGENEGNTIVVTGTRIRGARVVGEVISLDGEAIVEAGQVDLGEAIRSLPQNFSGGQNPGIGFGAGNANSNVNSASSANLRGLGPDATLTLLNGHRLPYDSALQGVDISAIPLPAVDRIEIVPDGASAIYGSDAVGGVVNVVLRRDFEGITTSGQIGASTDGGYFRQQADIVGGTRWSSGGFLLAYDFSNNSRIAARQRSYAASLDPETSLYPSQRRHAAIFSGHQMVASGVTARLDALYSTRSSRIVSGTPAARFVSEPDVEAITFAPSLEIELGSGWMATALGVFGRDRTHFQTNSTQNGAETVTTGCFCNAIASGEIGAEGPLFTLPGGAARLAVGAGFRNNRLDFSREINASPSAAFDITRRSRFAYGELFLPIISGSNDISGIERLSLSAALRYEDYPDLDQLATPRLGAIYSPVAGLTFRASWSRSFKAPTLFQQFTPYQAFLLPAVAFGAGSGPDTVLFTSGGNPDIQSERARSWTAGVELEPAGVPGLLVSATWYDIRYSDRVVQPIAGSIAAAFRDPGFASLIDFSPQADLLAGLISGAQLGLQNFSGSQYDAANVVALVDNRNINVAVQQIEGIDARISWTRRLRGDDSMSLELAGSWLDSDQQLTAALPKVQLSGTVFNPPRIRARGTARYETGAFKANAALNYTGALRDRRFAEESRIAPSATLDLGFSYEIIEGADRDPGLEVSLTIQNVFDDEPEVIAITGPNDTPYDSTNYSPIGRFIAFGIRRHW